ncbi:MAG: hypothetical protein U0984_08480 [Prosthecobacter sp.]|nr:hypothetical protein [Prosthecobacter sp.]
MRSPDYIPHCSPPALGCARPTCLGGKPPLNDLGIPEAIAIASVIASAASSAISYDSSQDQAKQAELNAQAQNEALKSEQDRQAAEFAENQRRTAEVHKRQRAQLRAALATTGVVQTTGTPIALVADTIKTQQVQIGDQSSVHNLTQRELAYRAGSVLAMGESQANSLRAQGIGNALSQLAQAGSQAYGIFNISPSTVRTPGVAPAPGYRSNRTVSQRPPGL